MCACENVCDIRANDAYACQVKIHSAVRYRPLVVNIAFHVPPFSSICCHSYFEILQLMCRSCPSATEARSQGDGVMVNPLLV